VPRRIFASDYRTARRKRRLIGGTTRRSLNWPKNSPMTMAVRVEGYLPSRQSGLWNGSAGMPSTWWRPPACGRGAVRHML